MVFRFYLLDVREVVMVVYQSPIGQLCVLSFALAWQKHPQNGHRDFLVIGFVPSICCLSGHDWHSSSL